MMSIVEPAALKRFQPGCGDLIMKTSIYRDEIASAIGAPGDSRRDLFAARSGRRADGRGMSRSRLFAGLLR